MECPVCGRTIQNNTKFCKYCGNALIKAHPKQSNTQLCPLCGTSLKPGISFCTQCGTPVIQKEGVIEEHPKRRNHFLPIVILFFLLSASLLFYISLKKGLIPINIPFFSDYTTQNSQADDESGAKGELSDHGEEAATAYSDYSGEASSNSTDGDNHTEDVSSSIMGSRTTIDKEIELGKYTLSYFGHNTVYTNHDVPVALFCPDEQGQNEYKRSYYYMNGELIFSEYAGDDLHQFFFDQGELIRWAYYSNPIVDSTVTNYDSENTEPYMKWEEQVLEESDELLGEWETSAAATSVSHVNHNDSLSPFYGIWIFASEDRDEAENRKKDAISKGFAAEILVTTDWSNLNDQKWFVVTTGIYQNEKAAKDELNHVLDSYPDAYIKYTGNFVQDYIISDSDKRYIETSELVDLSRMEVRTAINELYARHGRKFNDQSIQSYFDSKSWYKPQIDPDDFSDDVFNDFEIRNKEILVEWEIDHGWREGKSANNP